MLPTILNDITPPAAKGQAILSEDAEEEITLQFAAIMDAVEKDVPQPEKRASHTDLSIDAAQLLTKEKQAMSSGETDAVVADADAEKSAKLDVANALSGLDDAVKRPQVSPNEAQEKATSKKAEEPQSKTLAQKDAALDPILTLPRTSVAQSVLEGRLPVLPDGKGQITPPARTVLDEPQDQVKVVATNEGKLTPSSLPGDTPKAALQALPIPQKAPGKPAPTPEVERKAAPAHTEYDMRSATTLVTGAQPPAVAMVPAIPQVGLQQLDPAKFGLEVDGLLAASSFDRVGAPVQSSTAATLTATPEMARQVAQQIAVSVTNAGGRTTEIALNPEELGRVRMTMSVTEGSVTLHVSAERPETQDLLRRHIDVLAQEFRDLGYSSIDFSFGDQGEHNDDAMPTDENQSILADVEGASDVEVTAAPHSSSGLDLRI